MARLARLWKPFLTVSLVFLVFACSGGGCGGCAGCGITPIPGAFPLDARIPNAAQVRLTSSGISFIEDNIDGIIGTFLAGGLDFPVPPIDTTQSVPVVGDVRVRLCSDGDCSAHAEVMDLALTPTAPNVLHAVIEVAVESRNAAGMRASYPLRLGPNGCLFGICAIDTTCQVDIDTHAGDRAFIAFETDLFFETETEAARSGYTRLRIGPIAEVAGQGIEDADIGFGSCSGLVGGIINLVSGLLRGTIIDQLRGQIGALLDGAVGDNLCTQAGPTGCPTGTFADGPDATSICRFGPAATDRCVPILIGTDGRGDLGEAFLGGFSPGTHAPIQFVLASGGDGEATMDGMSLFMVGGFQSWNRDFTVTPGHNACVPMITPPPLPTVNRASAFRGNVIPGTATETHLGIGISEDYLDYAGYGLFDAGALCIGTGTRLSQQLSTGLVSALIQSLGSLAFPIEDAPLAIALRPQQPPDFTIGTASGAPLLNVTLPELQMDFYVWTTERYVRFMTYQTDLSIAINLTVEGGQIVPEIAGIVPSNSMVTNSELLTEDPSRLAGTLETVIMSFAGMFASGLSGFDLPAIMGFNLEVPAGGIRGVASDGENFLGIFANLALAPPSPLTAPVEVSVEVSDLTIDPSSMSIEGWNSGTGNTAWLYFDAEGPAGVDYEFSYRIDGTEWRPWTTDRRVMIDDDLLLFQARHVIEARGRVVGDYASVDRTPATAEVLVDILPPTIEVDAADAGWTITGRDVITGRDTLETRYRIADGEWSAWTTGRLFIESALAEGLDGTLDIEMRDEAGNVSVSAQPLIRGIVNPALAGGCGCRTASPSAPGNVAALLSALLGLAFLRRRARRSGKENARKASTFLGTRMKHLLGVFFTLAIVSMLSIGCSCGGPSNCNDECVGATGSSVNGSICCLGTNECVDYNLDALCDPGFTCPVANVVVENMTCDLSCSECMRKPALSAGLLATDLDFVTSAGGSFVSGYSPGNPPTAHYGDLVFGEVSASGEVTWEQPIDGAPNSPIVADPDGWRGGVAAAGDDVGRWTSMVDSGDRIYIAYYDVTNGDLKIAIGGPGSWDIHTIDETGNAGAYASLALTESGAPAVSYLRIEEQPDGTVRSGVRVATASSATPTATSNWTSVEVSGAITPCRGVDCGRGEACLDTGSCTMTGTGCTPACGSGEGCVGGMCVAVIEAGYVEDLAPRHGMYTQLVATTGGLALIWYDRTSGNLWGASATGGTFGAPFLIDGYMRTPGGGDSGIGASLFVDGAGTWHVTYVDGTEEELRYAQITSGAVALRERIDDGSTDGTTPHTDGRHVIGDDSSVVVTPSGEVRVAYQDATSATTMLARRTGAGTWSVSVIDDVDASGFWVEQVLTDSGSTVASFWRRNERSNPNGIRVTEVP